MTDDAAATSHPLPNLFIMRAIRLGGNRGKKKVEAKVLFIRENIGSERKLVVCFSCVPGGG